MDHDISNTPIKGTVIRIFDNIVEIKLVDIPDQIFHIPQAEIVGKFHWGMPVNIKLEIDSDKSRKVYLTRRDVEVDIAVVEEIEKLLDESSNYI